MFIYKKNKHLWRLCKKDNIPIIRKKTAKLINKIINKNNYKSMLEIGTAYGFSCSLWTQNNNLKRIVSIEKNTNNYLIANKNINDERLVLFNDDAFEIELKEKFDVIFIDGPKGNQDKLLEKSLLVLDENGTIIIDNLLLKKFSKIDNNKLSKNQKKLLEKIRMFREYLEKHEYINFKFLNIDDGVGIITKR